MSRRAALSLIAAFFLLHNAEEAIAFTWLWPFLRIRLAATIGLELGPSPVLMYLTLIAVSVLGLLIIGWVLQRPDDRARVFVALLAQMVVFLNALWHIGVSIVVLRGYTPGLATAVAINVPFSIYLFRRALREEWIPPKRT